MSGQKDPSIAVVRQVVFLQSRLRVRNLSLKLLEVLYQVVEGFGAIPGEGLHVLQFFAVLFEDAVDIMEGCHRRHEAFVYEINVENHTTICICV